MLSVHAEFVALAFQSMDELAPCKRLGHCLVHILPDSGAPAWSPFPVRQPVLIGLGDSIRTAAVDDGQAVLLTERIRDGTHLCDIGFGIAVIFFAVVQRHRIPDNVVMAMGRVQVGGDDRLIPPAQKLLGQLHADFVGQLRGDLARLEALHQMKPLYPARLMPALFAGFHVRKGGCGGAGQPGFKAGLFSLFPVQRVVDGILQRLRSGFLLVLHIVHCPVKAADGDNGCIRHFLSPVLLHFLPHLPGNAGHLGNPRQK